MDRVSFGIIGTGRIAGQFVSEAVLDSRIRLRGVCARDFEKTKVFARDFHIENPYASVKELLEDDSIDAVYIATFHPTHFIYTMMALEAGKHVLCEKPGALSAHEMEQVVEKAREKNLLYTEAVTVGFNPVYREIKREIAAGSIGRVVHVESSYGRVSTKVHKHNREQAGGALYDIGIYNVFLMTDLLGLPKDLTAYSRSHSWGVEGAVTCIAKHDSQATSSFYATMDSISGETAKIIGTQGVIEIPSSWTVASAFTLRDSSGEVRQYFSEDSSWLFHEIRAFTTAILGGHRDSPIMSMEKSIILHRTMDMIKEGLGLSLEDLETDIY